MSRHLQFCIGGKWVDPVAPRQIDVIDSSTQDPFPSISGGSAEDVGLAVAAAKAAFALLPSTGIASRAPAETMPMTAFTTSLR